MSGGRRRRAPLAALAVLAVAAGLPFVPAGVRAAAAQESGSLLRLASQTPWVGPGEELALRLNVTTSEAPAEVELAVAVYRRVTNRSEFTRTITDSLRGNPITVVPPARLSDLAGDPGGAVVVRLPIQDPAQPVDPARLRLTTEGVYPVRVELRETGGGTSLASMVTHLVYTRPPQPGGHALGVAIVLPVHAPPALSPDGKRSLAGRTALALRSLSSSLEAHSTVPLTLLPTPETLVSLDTSDSPENRETVSALARATTGRQVAAGTYVPVSLSSFATSGMAAEAAIQLDRGNEVIERTLGARPDPRTWVAEDGLDERGALLLRQQQVDRLVLHEAAMEPAKLDRTLTQPFELEARAVSRPIALAADEGLADHFAPADDPVLAAHRLLADLAVVYQDQPSRRRAVVVVPPRTWQPNRAFLDSLLGGLGMATVMVGTTLEDAFATVPPATTGTGAPLVRRLAATEPAPLLPADDFTAARRQLVGFASMLAPDNALDDSMEQLLLLAEGAGLRPGRRQDFIDGMLARIRAQTSAVQVPSRRSITLTARTGEIPVTILSTTGYQMKVQIRVASDKLEFPKGSVRSVDLARRSTTERFSVRARTSGSFPLRVSLLSPDGELDLGTSRFTVRSTAASGVGVVLSVGAIAFLLVWWTRHLVRGRRNRRLVPA